ncbi:MAG: hypothetical protein IJ051_07560, partial [Clostridia bacterium]|nr:hypothetical protein [Clostridia bacterium]
KRKEAFASFLFAILTGLEPKAGASRKQSCGLFLATGAAAAARSDLRSKACQVLLSAPDSDPFGVAFLLFSAYLQSVQLHYVQFV